MKRMLKPVVLGCITLGSLLLLGNSQPKSDSLTQEETKYIYLTFDDGPLRGSDKVNDAILYEKIPVSVLLVGKHAVTRNKDMELYRSNEYLHLGNHSYSHAHGKYHAFYEDPQAVLLDFIANMDTLQLDNKIVRMPGRNFWRVNGRSKDGITNGTLAADLLSDHGFSVLG